MIHFLETKVESWFYSSLVELQLHIPLPLSFLISMSLSISHRLYVSFCLSICLCFAYSLPLSHYVSLCPFLYLSLYVSLCLSVSLFLPLCALGLRHLWFFNRIFVLLWLLGGLFQGCYCVPDRNKLARANNTSKLNFAT